MLNLFITCSTSACNAERRCDPRTTILKLKGIVEIITGASAAFLDLRLMDAKGVQQTHPAEVCRLDDDNKCLEDYPVEDFMRIHILMKQAIDGNPHAVVGEFEDVSRVEKFELTEEEYTKKTDFSARELKPLTDTVRAFKLRNNLGRFNPDNIAKAEELKEVEGQEKAATIKVGDRCQVLIAGHGGPKRGSVAYVGKTQFQPGYWVGVRYDEPVGKHDGSVAGVKYFSCPNHYGAFVRPAAVEVGDFPELGLEDLDEM